MTMTEAELKKIRKWRIQRSCNHDFNTTDCTLCMISALLAHIDGLRDNLYLEQLEGDRELHAIVTERDALAAEVERLNQTIEYLDINVAYLSCGIHRNETNEHLV